VALEPGAPEGMPEVRRQVHCDVCRGDWKRCRLMVCPYLTEVRTWFDGQEPLRSRQLFGASPPSAFVGSWNYPKVLAGPLVPPIREGTAIMDASETWMGLDVWDILRFRLSLVRGKAARRVDVARDPDPLLRTVQEEAMADKPVDTELWLAKRPTLEGPFSGRASPTGPSAEIERLELAENPSVPRRVDYIASDTDLGAGDGVADLYRHGITQSHITRVFSVGLLGSRDRRRLVPTEWSITAVDDILGKRLAAAVKRNPWINEFQVFSATAFHNTVAVLLMPTAWMFEALEAWDIDRNPTPISDHEFHRGRTTYPDKIAGAYHATRLPVLEYLEREGRQAGAIVFMEVYSGWIPLGVWRYREIARSALGARPAKFDRMAEAEAALRRRLRLPLERWWRTSTLRTYLRRQRRITEYGSAPR